VRTLSKAVVVALTLWGGTASAQVVSAQVTVAAPTVHFEVAPPLVYVSPGVMVVQDYDEEIFFTGGWYWCRRGDVWFRTHDYHGGWVMAPHRYVPARIYRIPPGHYRNYRGGGFGHPAYAHPAYARPVRYHDNGNHGGYGRHEGRAWAPAPHRAMVVHEHGGGGGGGHGNGHGRH